MSSSMLKTMVLGLIFLSALAVTALAEEVPYTLADRERLIRVETKQDELEKRLIRVETKLEEMEKRFEQRFEQIDKRFEQIDKRLEQMEQRFEQRFGQMITLFLGIVAAFALVVAATIGFAVWDRRTALTPALRHSQGLEGRQDRVEQALRELAQQNPQVAEVLRRVGLL